MDKMLFFTSGQLAEVRKKSVVALRNIEEVEEALQPVLMQADKGDPKYETLVRVLEKISEFKASVALMNRQGQEIDRLLRVVGKGPNAYKKGGCHRK